MTSEIASLLAKGDKFFPSEDFINSTQLNNGPEFSSLYEASIRSGDTFWLKQAKANLAWTKEPSQSLNAYENHRYTWFEDGYLNVSVNCVDRHIPQKGDQMAMIWEGEPGDKQFVTYRELKHQIEMLCHGMKSLGLKAGDSVTIYMPLCPQQAIAMLACARMGIMHNVVFGGFSATSLRDRHQDAQSKLIITANVGYRRGKEVSFKDIVDQSLIDANHVKHVIVYERSPKTCPMQLGRDFYWHRLCESFSGLPFHPEGFPAEQPLFSLYTSGSTGKPKGLVHTSAGYLLQTMLSTKYMFDLPSTANRYWCTADFGWITGHSYVVYGPLANGATVFLYEGSPDYPNWLRFWQLIDNYEINVFYTAPTAIRALRQHTQSMLSEFNLSSLRLLGSVGEPISPDTWHWFYREVGKNRCPLIDTWWQTETGSIMLSAIPSLHPTKPGSAALPFFGVKPAIVDEDGQEVETGTGGFLVLKQPWPSMARTILGDHERYVKQYWQKFGKYYLTGDAARKDEDGYYWIMGRTDDVINVSGHRLSTMEIEAALCAHPCIAEAAVVAREDSLKGEAIVAYVCVKPEYQNHDQEQLASELKAHVTKEIGGLARPEQIEFSNKLPKTRSGKIMRRLLRDAAHNRPFQGDTSTLEG